MLRRGLVLDLAIAGGESPAVAPQYFAGGVICLKLCIADLILDRTGNNFRTLRHAFHDIENANFVGLPVVVWLSPAPCPSP